jgi:hypothetical protein
LEDPCGGGVVTNEAPWPEHQSRRKFVIIIVQAPLALALTCRIANPPGAKKIAQIAPLEESVPPRLYGGTERIVSNLAG